jgi:hypothetical protein
MAAPSAAALAARLKGDNRTVVGSADPADPTKEFAATFLGAEGDTHGLTTAKTADAAAFSTGVAAGEGEITVVEGNGGLTKNDLRTQYFISAANYDATKAGFGAKRCFVNSKGQPLKADGTPGTVDEAVDAETTDLSALGEAVTSWAQTIAGADRTPPPGVYSSSARATSLYAPYVGWTAQH